jgi:GNAT superfamily N-acetyltransferase
MASGPGETVRIRPREAGDLDRCVQVLAAVHQASGYPANWPADPARWLTPDGIARAWVATTVEVPVAGHLVLREPDSGLPGEQAAEVSRLFVAPAARRQGVAQALLDQAIGWATSNGRDLVLEVTDELRPARALYERAGFQLAGTTVADWTAPGGQPVTLHRYVRARGRLQVVFAAGRLEVAVVLPDGGVIGGGGPLFRVDPGVVVPAGPQPGADSPQRPTAAVAPGQQQGYDPDDQHDDAGHVHAQTGDCARRDGEREDGADRDHHQGRAGTKVHGM